MENITRKLIEKADKKPHTTINSESKSLNAEKNENRLDKTACC